MSFRQKAAFLMVWRDDLFHCVDTKSRRVIFMLLLPQTSWEDIAIGIQRFLDELQMVRRTTYDFLREHRDRDNAPK